MLNCLIGLHLFVITSMMIHHDCDIVAFQVMLALSCMAIVVKVNILNPAHMMVSDLAGESGGTTWSAHPLRQLGGHYAALEVPHAARLAHTSLTIHNTSTLLITATNYLIYKEPKLNRFDI